MTTELSLGVDLITFYNYKFWGFDDHGAFTERATSDPAWYWNTVLDTAQKAGVSALELTFPPADWESAVKSAGSADAFRAELDRRGLRVMSGFHNGSFWTSTTTKAEVAAEAEAYSEFLAASGGTHLVVGLPMRETGPSGSPIPVTFERAQHLADLTHAVAEVSHAHGIRTALHTEAHSVICTARDVDLFMLLTDPLYVDLCPDTAHLTLAGADPVAVARRHFERVGIAHWKDATGPMSLDVPIDHGIHELHRPYFCRVGAGSVDWAAWAEFAIERGITSPILLEIDAVPDPVAEIKLGTDFLRSLLPSTPASVER